MNLPEFHDVELQSIVPELQAAAQQRFQRLDKISADIKSMEKLFVKMAVPGFDFVSIGEGEDDEMALVWDEDDQKILFFYPTRETEAEARPLIECSASIRQEVYQAGLLKDLMRDAVLTLEDLEDVAPEERHLKSVK